MLRQVAIGIGCCVGCSCSESPADGPSSDAAPPPDVFVGDGGWPDSSAGDGPGAEDAGSDVDAAPNDPCPALPIPASCFGREVMFREWGPNATGDGTYFVDQAPYRLGFTRMKGRIWIVKFRTEENSYRGRISAYGDSEPGVAWISDQPCDAAFGIENKLAIWGPHGGGSLDFVVVRDADVAKLDTDPALASWAANPRLRAGHCYYVAFENVSLAPPQAIDESYVETVVDECGIAGDGTCWYLAMDFGHLLHDITTGQLIAGNVIPGLTQ